jgi:tripartite-type tricarboxylate transporter receptor subunit TctC
MQRRLFLATSLAAAAAGRVVNAQTLTKEVRFYNGFPPGGTSDLLGRFLAEGFKAFVSQPVVVENKTGASGFIAAEACARAAPDGHTLFLAPMALMTISTNMPGQKVPIDPRTDLVPISNVGGVYNVLVAGKHAPFRTIPELVDYAKKNPGKLTYASAGNGTSQHLSAELFKKLAGIDMLHIPYRGGAPAIQDMVAGNTHMMFGNLPEFLGQIRGGNLIPIAFGGTKPSALYPDLPLIGQWLPGYRITNWFGLVASAGTPAEWVKFWNDALRQVAATPDFQKRMADNGMEILVGTPEEFRNTITADDRRWREVIQSAGIKAD